MNPTDEQIRKLWEWCGFIGRGRSYTGQEIWIAPDEIEWFDKCVADIHNDGYARMPEKDSYYKLPPIDLNSLFLYAVPKITPKTLMMETYGDNGELKYDWCVLSDKTNGGIWNGNDKDPALALFKAILEVIDE